MDKGENEYAVVVNEEDFERVGLVGVNLWLHNSESGEVERVESNGIRDLEWKELVMWGRPRRVGIVGALWIRKCSNG